MEGNSSRTSIAAWQLMAGALQRPARFRTFQVYPKDPGGQPVAGSACSCLTPHVRQLTQE